MLPLVVGENTASLIWSTDEAYGTKLLELDNDELSRELRLKTEDKFGDISFIVKGKAISILTGERLVLNCMQHMSAIATKTNILCKKIDATNTKILDTRKTIPLNRKVQKWAVKIGGGKNHRYALDDMIMIKDNHIDFCGGIAQAIQKTKKYLLSKKLDLNIIVETRNIDEIKEVIDEGGISRILLDNFNYIQTQEAVKFINNRYETESSGGITEDLSLIHI